MEARETLLYENTLIDHFNQYNDNKNMYIDGCINILSNNNISKTISINNKAKFLTVLLQNKEKLMWRSILQYLDLPEIVKACEILDSNRYARQLNKKNKNSNRINQLNEGMNNLSLTSTKINMVKEWVRSLTDKQLIYRVLMFSMDQWKILADLTHLNPKKDFALEWFLPYCYGEVTTEGTIVEKIKNMNDNNFEQLYEEYNLSYQIIRLNLKTPSVRTKEIIARKEDINTLLWYWSEINHPSVNNILSNRLKEVDELNISYGKLVDLLMKINDKELFNQVLRITENKLNEYNVSLEGPIAVLGDASASMEVAINTSSIITSLLCSLAKAELHLFKDVDIKIDNPPTTVREAINFAKEMRASNSTSPASSLYYYYSKKKVVKTFIIVTDEEENTGYDRMQSWYNSKLESFFAALYKKYCKEIYPSKLIFISFTKPNVDGQMIRALKDEMGNITEFVDVYKFDVKNPDLNRLDLILEKMSRKNSEKKIKANIDDKTMLEYVLQRCNLNKDDVIKDMLN